MAPEPKHSFRELLIWGESRNQVVFLTVRGLSMVSSLIVVAALSVYQFGLYQLILAAVGFASLFASGFFDDVIINEVALALAKGKKTFAKRLFNEYLWGKIAIGLIGTVVLFFGADLVAHHYDKDIASYIRIASFLVAIGIMRTTESLFFRSIVSFAAFGAEAIYEAVRLILLIVLVSTKHLGLDTLLFASVIAALAALIYTSIFFLMRYWQVFRGVRGDSGWIAPRLVLGYGKWLIIRQAVSRTINGFDLWMIRLFLNTEAVGYYSFAETLLTILQGFIPTSMLGMLLPWEAGDRGRFRYIYRKMLKYGVWIGMLFAIPAFFLVPPLVHIFYPKFLTSMPIFRVIVSTLPFYAVYQFQKAFLITLREQELLAKRFLTEVAVNAAILAITLPTIGLYGAAVVLLVDYIGRVWLYGYSLRKRYDHLSFHLSSLIVIDQDDISFVKRAVSELFDIRRWLHPARSQINIPTEDLP